MLHSALQKLVATTETAGRESSDSSVDEEAEVLLAREAIRSCIEGHVQRGGGTDTVESALLHSAKSQGHGRLLYFEVDAQSSRWCRVGCELAVIDH